MKVKPLSRVRPLATPWTAAHQAPRPWIPPAGGVEWVPCLLQELLAMGHYLVDRPVDV